MAGVVKSWGGGEDPARYGAAGYCGAEDEEGGACAEERELF
jgi:hypothetical protein